MSQPQKSFLETLRDLFNQLFRSPPPPAAGGGQTPQPKPAAPVITDEPRAPLTPRVLVIVYDPVVDALKNTRLVEWGVKNRGWKRVEELLAGYVADVDECSGGLVKYNVVQRIDVDRFPLRLCGKRFTALEYLDLYTVNQGKYKEPDDRFDYHDLIKEFNLSERVNNGEVDEVWVFTYPFSGTYESVMCGTNAFWCNGPVIENTPGRRFAIMGFSYERGVGEMEEDLGHRAESIMGRMYQCADFVNWTYDYDRSRQPFVKNRPEAYDAVKFAETNLFAKFLLYDRIAPGNAQCGNVHYAPNSQKDYEWGSTTPVVTYADDWLAFPNLPRVQKMQNANTWGSGDIRGHHRWWFSRFPKVAGRMNGIRLNWWSYIADVTNPEFDPR
ncbi:MAG: hypothetical protein HY741_27205 [Chloroflexi bacterium]|nr:hypothetical protein [Chloroflexota bacterium]